jgi:hypothetical protein
VKQFGFGRRTATLLWKIWDRIAATNPNMTQQELNWTFTRAISQLCYNQGEQLPGQWRAGAGYVYEYSEADEKKYFLALGLPEKDFLYLLYKVRVQHQMVSNPGGHSPEELFEIKIKKLQTVRLSKVIRFETKPLVDHKKSFCW